MAFNNHNAAEDNDAKSFFWNSKIREMSTSATEWSEINWSDVVRWHLKKSFSHRNTNAQRKHLGKGREKVKRYDYFLSRLLQVFWHLLRFYNVKSILLCWIAECALIISLQKPYGKTCTVNVRRRREKMPCSKVLNEFRNDVSIKIMLFFVWWLFSLFFFNGFFAHHLNNEEDMGQTYKCTNKTRKNPVWCCSCLEATVKQSTVKRKVLRWKMR